MGHDLGHRRLVALAVAARPYRQDDLAGQMDADVRRLPHRGAPAFANGADPFRGGDTAYLEIGRQADAKVFAALASLLLRLVDLVVAGHRERPIERGRVVPRVDRDLGAVRGSEEAFGML